MLLAYDMLIHDLIMHIFILFGEIIRQTRQLFFNNHDDLCWEISVESSEVITIMMMID